MKRPGHTYRIHDFGPLTLAFDPEARGGTYNPEIHVIYRQRRRRRDMTGWSPSCTHEVIYRRVGFRLPVLGFARAWRLRRFGALRVYAATARLVYRAFNGRTAAR